MRNKQLKILVMILVVLALGSLLVAACARSGHDYWSRCDTNE
jgi:hypothetical protein